MRFLVISREIPPVGGGAGYVAIQLADQLADRGHDIDLVTMGFRNLPAREERPSGVRIHRVACGRRRQDSSDFPSMGRFVTKATMTAKRINEIGRLDIAHAHGIVPDGIAAWRLKRTLGIPFAITAHGSDVPGYNPEQFRWAHLLASPVWKRVMNHADLIVTPSDHLAGLVADRTANARPRVIPNGIDTDLFTDDVLDEKRPAFLIMARLVPRKNFHLFLQALQQIDESQEVHVVGEGAEFPRLQSLARALPQHRVGFHGWLENGSPTWHRLYRECRFFVSPSNSENFPINLLEAQLAGMTVLSSAIPGAREVLGDDAIYFSDISREGIAATVKSALTKSSEILDSLGKKARQRVQDRFSWQAISDEYDHALAPLRTAHHG